jgi:two-component system, NtrC family, sensor kinase
MSFVSLGGPCCIAVTLLISRYDCMKPETGISISSKRTREPTRPPGTPSHLEAVQYYHSRLKHGILICLFITYLIPVVVLTFYFNYHFDSNMRESSKLQLAAIAESQRNTIDLFLQKRIVNVFNLFHMKEFTLDPTPENMRAYLENLIRSDDAFVDVGIIDPQGIQTGYAGPYDHLYGKDYSSEKWFIDLMNQRESYIVTDLYLGLRRQPHITIGVKQLVDENFYVIRTSVYPDKLVDLIRVSNHGKDTAGYLVNQKGIYQVVEPGFGQLLAPAHYIPEPGRDAEVSSISFDGETFLAAHIRLREVPWSLVMLQPETIAFKEMYAIRNTMIIGSALLILVVMVFIWFVVNSLFRRARAVDQERVELKGQLYHAHKLVSVGQLAGGVAHEINNPLAIIESEAGIIRDMLDPEMGLDASPDAIRKELDEIDKAVNRARGITQKILSFVRKTDPKLVESDINQLLDEVVSGVKEQEFKVSDIKLIKDYDTKLPMLYVDPDLIRQVF